MAREAWVQDRPRGDYGFDAPYVPIGLGLGGVALLALAVLNAVQGSVGGTIGSSIAAAWLLLSAASYVYTTRRGKFIVWAEILSGLRLRGDERLLDLGCGRGAVLLAAAKLVPHGKAVGVDIWRPDQTGNSMRATLANADAEGVADRVELHTRDMTDLQFPDASFDLVVSNLAIHNLPGNPARLAAIDEAVRVLRPGGRLVIADLGFTKLYARRLGKLGMANIGRQDLGWRAWWGLPFIRTHAVTATKPEPA